MLYKFLLLMIVLALTSIANCQPEVRVVNGYETNIKKYPFIISLRDKDGKHGCGGTIIDSSWIMTAAHCIGGATADEMSVEYGTAKISPTGKNIAAIKRVIIHENYDKPHKFDNDIALLELKEPLPLNDKNIVAIELPKSKFEIPQNAEGATGYLAGWGNTHVDGEIQTKLRDVKLKIYSDKECQSRFEGTTKDHICAGSDDGTKGECNGDSGGPLVYKKNIQLGIVSRGKRPCGESGVPGVYTKVSHYVKWIKENKK